MIERLSYHKLYNSIGILMANVHSLFGNKSGLYLLGTSKMKKMKMKVEKGLQVADDANESSKVPPFG